jgi:hypothetical protein
MTSFLRISAMMASAQVIRCLSDERLRSEIATSERRREDSVEVEDV